MGAARTFTDAEADGELQVMSGLSTAAIPQVIVTARNLGHPASSVSTRSSRTVRRTAPTSEHPLNSGVTAAGRHGT